MRGRGSRIKIKVGTLKKDITAYGNKYWIQVEDTKNSCNEDLEHLIDETITIVFGSAESLLDAIEEYKVDE